MSDLCDQSLQTFTFLLSEHIGCRQLVVIPCSLQAKQHMNTATQRVTLGAEAAYSWSLVVLPPLQVLSQLRNTATAGA